MTGRVLAAMLSVFVFMFLIFVSISFYLYTGVNERVNDICYDIADTISTKGMLTQELYDYFIQSISRYGTFHTEMRLTIAGEEGPDIYYAADDIIGRPFIRGDRLLLAVYDITPSLFERLTGVVLRPAACKTAVIG